MTNLPWWLVLTCGKSSHCASSGNPCRCTAHRPEVHQQPMRKAVGIILWWAVLLGLWQLYVGQTTKETTIAGAVAAALAVGAGALLARLGLYRLGLDPRWLGRAATTPWYLVRDFAVVTL